MKEKYIKMKNTANKLSNEYHDNDDNGTWNSI